MKDDVMGQRTLGTRWEQGERERSQVKLTFNDVIYVGHGEINNTSA